MGSHDADYCEDHYCQCINRMKVNKGDVVELILIDRGKYFNVSNHPMHIHGHNFHILAQGQVMHLYSDYLLELMTMAMIINVFYNFYKNL